MAPDAQEEADRVRALTTRYVAALASRGLLDFDDLLLKGLALARDAAAASRFTRRFRHVLVDEFQDTSAEQCELVAALAAVHGNVTLVGDPQQCIYSWRQAERANLSILRARWEARRAAAGAAGSAAAAADADVLACCPLTQSYRSTQRILRCAREILSSPLILGDGPAPDDPHEPRAPPALWSAHGEGAPVACHLYENCAAEADGVAFHVSRLLAAATAAAHAARPRPTAPRSPRGPAASQPRGRRRRRRRRSSGGGVSPGAPPPLRPSDIAVLARTARQLKAVQEALERRGVPCSVQGSGRLADQPEVRTVLAHLALVVDPNDREAFERACKATKGLGDATLRAVTADADAGGRSLLSALQQLVRNNGGAAGGGSAVHAARGLVHRIERLCRLSREHSGVEALVACAMEVLPPPATAPSAGGGGVASGSGVPPATASFATASSLSGGAARSNVSAPPATAQSSGSALETVRSLARQHDEGWPAAPTVVSPRAGDGGADAADGSASLRAFLHSMGLGIDSSDASGDGGGVSLSTVHRAKGLEWRLVWMIGVDDASYPHRRGVREAFDAGGAHAAAATLREERRLLYVGVTRAKEALVVSRALYRGDAGGADLSAPSPFLRGLRPADAEPRVFLPPSVAARLTSVVEPTLITQTEAEQLERPAPARWLAAFDARLDMAKGGRLAAAQENAFLVARYGEDYLTSYAMEAPPAASHDDDRDEQGAWSEQGPCGPEDEEGGGSHRGARGKLAGTQERGVPLAPLVPSGGFKNASRVLLNSKPMATGASGDAAHSTRAPIYRPSGGTQLGGRRLLGGGGGGGSLLGRPTSSSSAGAAFKKPRMIG